MFVHQRLSARGKVALLVKHLVVGQRLLGVLRFPLAVVQHTRQVIALAFTHAGVANNHQHITGNFFGHFGTSFPQAGFHGGAQQQIFRRVAG